MPVKPAACDEQVRDTKSLAGAMKLYASLGDQLQQQYLDNWSRQELKACRRQLLDAYGPAVREYGTYNEIMQKLSPYISVQRPKGAGVMIVVFGEDRNVHKSEFVPVAAIEDPALRREAKDRETRTMRGSEVHLTRPLAEGALRYSISARKLEEAVRRLSTQVPVPGKDRVTGTRRGTRKIEI